MKKKRVLAFGTFDLIHSGHVFFLNEARKLGDELIVVVSRDKNAEKIKGEAPVNHEKERLFVVQALTAVEKAFLGQEEDFLLSVIGLKPEVIALGYDQKPSETELKKQLAERNFSCEIRRLPPYNEEESKTSKIKKKIKDN